MENEKIKNSKKYSLNELVEKVDKLRKQDDFDLSLEQDLVIWIMNLISIEEHLLFSYNKTWKTKYLNLLNEARNHRKILLKEVIKEYEWEVRCTAKHLLSTCMRLMEVGTKQLWLWKEEKARQFFDQSYDMYCMFWWIVMDMIQGNESDENNKSENNEKTDNKLIWDIIDCCDE